MLTAGQPVGTGRAGCLCWQPLQGRSTLMNQADLIAAVAERAGLTKADAGKALEALIGSITDALKQGDEVRIAGFGTFGAGPRAIPAPSSAAGYARMRYR